MMPDYYVEGVPLTVVGLGDAVVLHPDGRREPFEGFVGAPGEDIAVAIQRSLPEGATLLLKKQG